MSVQSVKVWLAEHAPDIAVIELEESTATVPLAAAAHGVLPGQIGKTLSLKTPTGVVLLVTRGDARIDNKKAKEAFGGRVSMLGLDEVEAITGHPVGGVCPFGLATPLPVYCDVSLKAFDVVIPAAGGVKASLRITPERMAALTGATWVDACQEVQAS